MGEYDFVLSGASGLLGEVPVVSPGPGGEYRRLPGGVSFPVVPVGYVLPVHREWAELQERKGRQPPFYVTSKRGTVGWVPWPGSVVVWPHEQAWEIDRLQVASTPGKPAARLPDLRPSEKKG